MQPNKVHTVGFIPMHPITYLAARIANAFIDTRHYWGDYRANREAL